MQASVPTPVAALRAFSEATCSFKEVMVQGCTVFCVWQRWKGGGGGGMREFFEGKVADGASLAAVVLMAMMMCVTTGEERR